jgi:Ran GTPase-activating protein (RanGAP) involved in mRNA processing and transport
MCLFFNIVYLDRQGFREINLSNNPLGDEGVRELCLAIEKTETLRILHLAFCDLMDNSMLRIQRALVANSSIVSLDVSHNTVSEEVEIRANVRRNTVYDCDGDHVF